MEENSKPQSESHETIKFEVRPYKFSELAKIYHVNVQTFKKWIRRLRRKLGQIAGHFLTIAQVEIIVAHLKLPYFVKVEVVSEEEFDKAVDKRVQQMPKPLQQTSKELEQTQKTKRQKKIKTSKRRKTFLRKRSKRK